MNPSAAEPALSFDVTEADFRQTVLERSLDVPVLLDCWAPWCGPCRNLKPVLEKLVRDYGGSFVLAKLNTDEAPQISAALQIRSIPLVVLFIGGKPVDQFMGALPESKVREFLDKHIGEQVSEVDALRAEAAAEADPAVAEAMLQRGAELEPGHTEVALDLAARLVDRGAFDDADGLARRHRPPSSATSGMRRCSSASSWRRTGPKATRRPWPRASPRTPRTSRRVSRSPRCMPTRATSTPPSTNCSRWCCATRPSGARRRA